jgi:hypothetical protein
VGVPYPQGVIGKHSQAQADATIQDATLNVQGVTDISSFSSSIDPSNRAYSATMTIDTVYGPTEVDLQNFLDY